ncbi:MAG: hypothetical protein ACPHO9_04320 [Ilumatobacteraceae bacterium]
MDPLLGVEGHAAVVGEQHVDLDIGTPECLHQPAGGGGEPTHGDQRCQLGGREGDAHPIIVVDQAATDTHSVHIGRLGCPVQNDPTHNGGA